jgi:hypothetical protein
LSSRNICAQQGDEKLKQEVENGPRVHRLCVRWKTMKSFRRWCSRLSRSPSLTFFLNLLSLGDYPNRLLDCSSCPTTTKNEVQRKEKLNAGKRVDNRKR